MGCNCSWLFISICSAIPEQKTSRFVFFMASNSFLAYLILMYLFTADISLGFAAGVMTAASFWSLLAPAIEIRCDLITLDTMY